jgi:hypothetical protein
MGLRILGRYRRMFRLVLGADLARFRIPRLVVLMRGTQSREIGFFRLVCGGCALRSRGAGSKRWYRGG